MKRLLRLLIAFALGLNACSSTAPIIPSVPTAEKKVLPGASAKKKKDEPEPKPPEEKWLCKVSNGEGRVFRLIGESRAAAESKAREECQIYSRRCALLDCNAFVPEE